MEGDLIFVNIDPEFNIALEVLEELEREERLTVTHQQRARLVVIQSDAEGEANIFKFGGETSANQRAYTFGKTASSVFRMVMLKAVQIKENCWPELGDRSMPRNKNPPNLTFEVARGYLPFRLFVEEEEEEEVEEEEVEEEEEEEVGVNNYKATSQRFWARYDHVFPRYLIKSKVLENRGRRVNFHNKMLIFRDDFKEVIEIITTANATMDPPGWEANEFDSTVTVECLRKTIKQDKKFTDGKWFEKFKKVIAENKEKKSEVCEVEVRSRDDVLKMLKKDELSRTKKGDGGELPNMEDLSLGGSK